jgi:DNA polymerase
VIVSAATKTSFTLTRPRVNKPTFMLVGEAPGYQEDKQGKPFVGRSGQFLEHCLKILELDNVVLTNAVRCRPPDNRDPYAKERRACLPWLDKEIDELQPEIIVCLGGIAYTSIFNLPHRAAISKNRLSLQEYTTPEGTTVPVGITFHPAYCLRNALKKPDFLNDLHYYLVEQGWKAENRESGIQVTLLTDGGECLGLNALIAGEERVALDIETVGVSDKVLTVGLSRQPYESSVIPIHHPESTIRNPEDLLYVIADQLLSTNKIVEGQFLEFDLARLASGSGYKGAIRVKARDSSCYHAMLDGEATNRSLDYLAKTFTDEPPHKEMVDVTQLQNEPLELVAKYNGIDTALPPIIIDNILAQVKERGEYSPYLDEWYQRVVPFCAELHRHGMKLDLTRLSEIQEKYEFKRDIYLKSCDNYFDGDNLGSDAQVSDCLYGSLGVEIPYDFEGDVVGKSGRPSVAAPVLNYLLAQKETPDEARTFIEELLIYKKYRSLVSKFITGPKGIRANLYPDDFIHPQYYIIKTELEGGTATGRLSAKLPAVQTIEKKSELKKAFVSRYKDGWIMEIDGDQMELRIAGILSQDSYLHEVFTEDKDPHQATADLCGVSRFEGKTINFALIYGASRDKLVELGLSEEKADEVYTTLEDSLVMLYKYMEELVWQFRKTKKMVGPYGRIRRFADNRDVLAAKNFMVQHIASDICQDLGARLTLELEGYAVPIYSGHDGLAFDVKGHRVNATIDTMRELVASLPEIMKESFNMEATLPLKFTITKGRNWREQEEC